MAVLTYRNDVLTNYFLTKYFIWTFSTVEPYHYYELWHTEKLIAKQNIFKHCSIVFKYRIQINDKIPDIILLTLTFTISPPLIFATTTRVNFARKYCFLIKAF